jgi:hypothetical protein
VLGMIPDTEAKPRPRHLRDEQWDLLQQSDPILFRVAQLKLHRFR